MQKNTFIEFVIKTIDDMKGRDIIDIDVAERSSVMEHLIICSGNSKRHVSAIASQVVTESKQIAHPPLNTEGKEFGEWVLVDFGDVVVHVMQDEARDFYQLEQLWQK